MAARSLLTSVEDFTLTVENLLAESYLVPSDSVRPEFRGFKGIAHPPD
jgi:hypothetical protein